MNEQKNEMKRTEDYQICIDKDIKTNNTTVNMDTIINTDINDDINSNTNSYVTTQK